MLDSPLVIAGSGRSGTTWVLDSIAEANRCRTIFEPLHPYSIKEATPFANRYVRGNENYPALKSYLDNVFKGEIKSIWAKYRIRPDRMNPLSENSKMMRSRLEKSQRLKYILAQYHRFIINYLRFGKPRYQKFITKFIRANMMLEWIMKNYNARIIYIVRHPGAMVASTLKLTSSMKLTNWRIEEVYRNYLNDTKLVSDLLEKHNIAMPELNDRTSIITALWCIENQFNLKTINKSKIFVEHYENLIVNQNGNWDKMVDYLDLNHSPEGSALRLPSQQASEIIKKEGLDRSQLSRWRSNLNAEQLDTIQKILDLFEVTVYNVDELMPLPG